MNDRVAEIEAEPRQISEVPIGMNFPRIALDQCKF
jgi:hypothetical protein